MSILDFIGPKSYLYTLPHFLSGTSAWEQHIPFAFLVTDLLKPVEVVELGTHKGDSYLAFCQAIKEVSPSSRASAVDTWAGEEHAGIYDESIFENLKSYHDPRYTSFSRLLRSTFDEAADSFGDGSIDLLHIDGLHTYDAVKSDYETWLPKLSDRAVVLFHDTQVRDRGFGVWRLWEELTSRYPNFEFTHASGLGVLGVGSSLPKELLPLFNLTSSEQEALRSVCQGLGHRVALHGGYQHREGERNQALAELAGAKIIITQNEQEYTKLRVQHAELTAQHAQLTAQHASTTKELQNEKDSNALLVRQNEDFARLVQCFESSLSWRITRPLRQLRGVFTTE